VYPIPKQFPYFKWYPADAETDAEYCSMTLMERGLYHTLLNLSWLNNGLPQDPTSLQLLVKCPKDQFTKAWPKVSRCFDVAPDGKLRNKRQEEERAKAANRSSKATDAVRTRYERTTNDLPRAYDYDYVSSSVVTSQEKQTASCESGTDDWARSIYNRWKKSKNRILAEQALSELSDTDRAAFDATYAKWLDYHERAGWQYAPPLAVFLSDRTYEIEPPAATPRRKSAADEAFEQAMAKIEREDG
jgi:uncharacterized protein YdaU (DUF1376 family)